MASVAARLLPAAGATIVDIGCGTGANIAAFPTTHERIGYDPAPRAIELARSRHAGVRFEVAGALSAADGDAVGRADLVLLMDVLEHVHEDAELLTAVLSAMRPGAHVLITVPAGPELWSAHDVAVEHLRRYTEESLAALWAGRNVSVRLMSRFNARLYWAVRAWRRARRRRAGEVDVRVPPRWLNSLLLRVFVGEAAGLAGALDGRTARRRGVSWIAVLRRERHFTR